MPDVVIWRAGPFADAFDSYKDEPEIPVDSTLPVNPPPEEGTASWVEKHYFDLSGTLDEDSSIYDTDVVGTYFYDDQTAGSDTRGTRTVTMSMSFRYQAADDFLLSLNYNLFAFVEGSGGTAVATATITATDSETVGGFVDTTTDSPAPGVDAVAILMPFMGNPTLSLLAATVPGSFDITATVEISGPSTGTLFLLFEIIGDSPAP
jgi:hypothetical protein